MYCASLKRSQVGKRNITCGEKISTISYRKECKKDTQQSRAYAIEKGGVLGN